MAEDICKLLRTYEKKHMNTKLGSIPHILDQLGAYWSMLRWFYTILKIKHQCQKLQFLTFLPENPTYKKISMQNLQMDTDAYSVQLKNHVN